MLLVNKERLLFFTTDCRYLLFVSMIGILSLLWFCLSVAPHRNGRTLAADYLAYGLSEGDEIRQLDRGDLPVPVPCCTSPPSRLANFGPGGPPGPKREGSKNCKAFLVHRLSDSDYIWRG